MASSGAACRQQLSGDGNEFDSNANSRTCQQRHETSIKSESSLISTPTKSPACTALESNNSPRSPSPAEDVVLRLTSTPASGDTVTSADDGHVNRLTVRLPQDPYHSPVMHHRGAYNSPASVPQAKRPTNLATLSDSSVCILEDMAPMEQMCRNIGTAGEDNELRPSTSTSSRSRASTNSQQSTQTHQHPADFPNAVSVPIVGFEIMEERDKFTVFKIHVQKSDTEQWFIFRRYTDFVRLNTKLKELFPCFRLALPNKKYFGDNFDRNFLEDRVLGLQAFLNNITGHSRVYSSEPVQGFLCLDDPPGAQDSLEESRALCESLEEQVYSLTRELQDRDTHVSLLQEELAIAKSQTENLTRALRIERQLNKARRGSPMSQKSECSLVEQDQASCVEADLESNQLESPGLLRCLGG